MRISTSRGAAVAAIVACSVTSAAAQSRSPVPSSRTLPVSQIQFSFEADRLPAPDPKFLPSQQRLAPSDRGQPRAQYLRWLDGRTHLRSDRTRIEFYPIRGSGLHVSAGSRLHAGYQATSIALDNRDALRLDPRRQNGPVPLSAGYDRTAPVALVGYDAHIADRWTLGVDAGAMRGRTASIDSFTATGADVSGGYDDLRGRMNPLVDLTLNFAF